MFHIYIYVLYCCCCLFLTQHQLIYTAALARLKCPQAIALLLDGCLHDVMRRRRMERRKRKKVDEFPYFSFFVSNLLSMVVECCARCVKKEYTTEQQLFSENRKKSHLKFYALYDIYVVLLMFKFKALFPLHAHMGSDTNFFTLC